MLKDYFFYPVACLLMAGAVAFALSFGQPLTTKTADIMTEGFEISGDALSDLNVSPGMRLIYHAATDMQPAHVRLSSQIRRDTAPQSAGIFVSVPKVYLQALKGQDLTFVVTARASATESLVEFNMGYFTDSTSTANSTGWHQKTLLGDWRRFITPVKLPKETIGGGQHILAIWPGDTSQMRQMDIVRIRLTRTENLSRGQ